ncbi:lipoate--protein ligase family protein [Halostagnicola sp. A-GB9-2]|uniref:lipoate--protein ligase family protein n=1 Tax=Halostagnicola sp. A-GB9-2 TaxID=3048066 RepID=UPI0024C09B63|nr:lipoate--protein ligase family protein [Halostagnicola sp. A-GB9-2]MDJ1431336.1 lipoate--protein ligase family protein [Halostagnicola sp. A-GB9-2]
MSVTVLRGRAESVDADRAASQRLLEIASGGTPAVRVWRPHRQVAFGRRDARLEGYEDAQAVARTHGFPPVERSVGGRAVAYDGETTLAFARAEPVEDFRQGTDERYERLTNNLERALERLDIDAVRGEPDDSFCPGAHSLSVANSRDHAGSPLSAEPRKIVGIAQRVQQDAALASGIIVVANRDELANVLAGVYEALEIPFDSASVGAIANTGRSGRGETGSRSGGRLDTERVRRVLEETLVGDRQIEAVNVD